MMEGTNFGKLDDMFNLFDSAEILAEHVIQLECAFNRVSYLNLTYPGSTLSLKSRK